jgi:hypothetical protein
MYMLIVHGHNSIQWANNYSELLKLHKDVNKWSEILAGNTFPYTMTELVEEFNEAGRITYDVNDDGYMITIIEQGGDL